MLRIKVDRCVTIVRPSLRGSKRRSYAGSASDYLPSRQTTATQSSGSDSNHDRLYLPHSSVCRMTRTQSERFLELPPDHQVSGRLYRTQRTRAAPGGMWLVRGEFFLRYKMDERFCGWGGEDTELLGRIPRIRLSGPLFHLWHARADRSNVLSNRRLLGRIRRQRRQRARSSVPSTSVHDGLPMQQYPDVAPAMRSLFADYPPTRLLEIGTAAGGLSMLLRELCPEVPIRSYDVRPSPHLAKLVAAGIDARTADVFSPQVLSEIADYVQQPGRSVILCDGGDKPSELRQMAQIAKPGDLILAHDYACDRKHFHREMRGSRWDWCEITDADWQPLSNVHKLPREDLARVAWLVTEVRNVDEGESGVARWST